MAYQEFSGYSVNSNSRLYIGKIYDNTTSNIIGHCFNEKWNEWIMNDVN